ncbi:MAG: NERD domain-containing protein [Candidatus Hatepunaea meridiana]|nr:NERD domain-containing protein [Candidatus Hatepunaea meridiana]
MAKIYGESDSVKTFLERLNGHFKVITINTFEEFIDFSNNPSICQRRAGDRYNKGNIIFTNDITNLKTEIKNASLEISTIQDKLGRKYSTVKKVYGQLKDEIQSEIDDLKSKKSRLEKKKLRYEKDLNDVEAKLVKLNDERKSKLKKIAVDIKLFEKYRSDKNFRSQLQGAYGEYKVIEHIRDLYRKQSDYHLINALDLNVIGKALSFKDHTLVENKLDHVLICPKGVFVIETKAWKVIPTEGLKNVSDQLDKIQYVFRKVFGDKIDTKLMEVILVTTEKKIELPIKSKHTSISISELANYIGDKPKRLSKDNIIEILNVFLPHLDKGHIGTLSRVGIKLGVFISKLMRGKK